MQAGILARIQRDQVDVTQPPVQQAGEVASLLVRIVDAGHQRVLETHPPPGSHYVVVGGGDDLGNRPAAIDRHQTRAQLIPRGVK